MTPLKRIAHLLAVPALGAVIFCIYLATGGDWGREFLKSRLARAMVSPTYTLRADATGGDCASIGTWDAGRRTCALTGDITTGASVYIRDDGITLDGAARAMTGAGTGVAVTVIGASGITVRNLRIDGYEEGLFLQYAKRNTITGLRISGTTGHAMHLTGRSDLNAIVNNQITSSKMNGIAMWSSQGNTIANNRINGAVDCIRLQSSDGNVIAMNEIQNCEIEGLDLHVSRANRVFLNDVIQAALPVLDDLEGQNLYSLDLGGNHYVPKDSTKAGCTDADGDGTCDKEYRFARGIDSRPLSRPVALITGPR